jgi:hypothetical protein
MGDDVLTEQLRQWAVAQLRQVVALDRPYRRETPIERNRKFAPNTRERAAKRLVARDGSSRRTMMAAAAEVRKLHMVPMWACDPIPCKESEQYGPPPAQRAAVVVEGVPEELRWIDRALSQLARQNLIRALCVREEFTGTGTQSIKASRVAEQYGGKFSVWMYRQELRKGLEFMDARRA